MRRKRVLFLVLFFAISVAFNSVAFGEVEYRLRPGDIVKIKVKRQKKLDRVLSVRPDGKIYFPLIGAVQAAGSTYNELARRIRDELSVYIKKPEVTVFRPAVSPVRGVILEGEEVTLATKVFTLKHANAVMLRESLEGTVSEAGKVSADANTNSLIVTDVPSNLVGIGEVIRQLDRYGAESKQVLIEARIIELTHREDEEIGVKWFIDKVSGKRYAGSFEKEFRLPPLTTEVTDAVESGGVALERRTIIPNVGLSTLAQGGSFFYGEIIKGYDLSSIINALSEEGKAKILARPRIMVENGREASIEIVSRLPYRELSRTGTGATTDLIFTTSFLDVGVILKVTPYIKMDEVIEVKVEPEVSFVQGERVDIPIKVSRKARTRVNIKDGHTLVIGGLLQDREIKTVRKIPLLGDIPLLGFLFRYKITEKEKTELMVFITPHIISKSKSIKIAEAGLERAEEITRSIDERTRTRRMREYLIESRRLYKQGHYEEALEELAKVYRFDRDNRKAKNLERLIRIKQKKAKK